MEKIDMPDWAGVDWTPIGNTNNMDNEDRIVLLLKKVNEIVDWINSQN